MKRYFSILIIFIIASPIFGQSSNKKTIIIGQNEELNIKAIKQTDNFKYYLLIKGQNKTDSLLIDSLGNNWDNDECKIWTNQNVGNKNNEIIIIALSHSFHYTSGQHAMNDSTNIIQIWDLKNKIKIFNAVRFYASEGSAPTQDTIIENTDSSFVSYVCTWNCAYSYNVNFLDNGQISIENRDIISNNNDCENTCEQPDKEDGIYFFNNKQYILIEKE